MFRDGQFCARFYPRRHRQIARGPPHEVVGVLRKIGAKRAVNRERQLARVAPFEVITTLGERHQTIEYVVAIGTTAGDVQEQIHLRRGEFCQSTHTAAIIARHAPAKCLRVFGRHSLVRVIACYWPLTTGAEEGACSFASNFAMSSGAGFRVRARRH